MLRPFPISLLFSKILWALLALTLPLTLFLTLHQKTILLEWEFAPFLSAPLNFMFILDPKGMMFSCVVMLISANVIHFANTYMPHDFNLPRFTYLVLLFIMSMLLLLTIPHLMAILLGWDGLGLVSFLLVMYYQNPASWGAAMMTVLSNRVGDVMILLSIGWMLTQGHWTITLMSPLSLSNFIILSIMIAGMTKSAQIPFSSWLPAAMAAPTPVSALVHSSTLVTAGVFLLIRFYPFLHTYKIFNPTLALIASLTTLMAGLTAMLECDLKKIIALSTLSQLGIMMAAIGLNMPLFAFFHLLTHALFKALLFICAGSLIHLFHHAQDIRQMGNISFNMPLTTSCIIISNLALSGMPFLAGFYSKDLILESTFLTPFNWLIIMLLMTGTILTAAYSTRMMLLSLWSPMKSLPLHNINNNTLDLTTPAIFMSLAAILGGATMNWQFLTPIFEPVIPLKLTLAPLLLLISGFFLSWPFSSITSSPSRSSDATLTMWFLTPLTTQKILTNPMHLSHLTMKFIDQGWTESILGQGTKTLSLNTLKIPQRLQTNSLTSFILLSSTILLPLWLML